MKRLNLFANTKKSLIITTAVVSGLVVGGLGITQSEAALDWLGLQQKLENHDEQLDNHDDRITNTEADVDKLQKETDTQPAPERVIVREVVTPNPVVEEVPEPSPAPTPKPVTVVGYEVIPNGDEFNCKYTYSDGTTHTFRWKYPGPPVSGGYSNMINKGYCDDRALGG